MDSLTVFVFPGVFLGSVLVFCVVASHSNVWNYSRNLRLSVRDWGTPFECGCLSNLHYSSYLGFSYIVLLVFFVIFDLEVALLLGVPFQGSLFSGFWYYLLFLCFLLFGYSLEADRGYAEWGV